MVPSEMLTSQQNSTKDLTMENTPVTTDQPKDRNADQDISTRENQDAVETSDPKETLTQRNTTVQSQADKLEERLIK